MYRAYFNHNLTAFYHKSRPKIISRKILDYSAFYSISYIDYTTKGYM